MHQYLWKSNEYVEVIENPDIEEVENIYKKFIKEYNKRFEK